MAAGKSTGVGTQTPAQHARQIIDASFVDFSKKKRIRAAEQALTIDCDCFVAYLQLGDARINHSGQTNQLR